MILVGDFRQPQTNSRELMSWNMDFAARGGTAKGNAVSETSAGSIIVCSEVFLPLPLNHMDLAAVEGRTGDGQCSLSNVAIHIS